MHIHIRRNTVVPGFRVHGFSALPGFRALKAGDGAWSVHKTLFGFRAPLFQHLISDNFVFFTGKTYISGGSEDQSLLQLFLQKIMADTCR